MAMTSEPRVLSIQSHVVSGYVGNRCAVFPLQLLGFEVDFINSVQFSNHTYYKVFKGQVLNADDLDTLYAGLQENRLNNYTHVLTGYIGDVSFLHKVCDIVSQLKKINPKLVYVCDPVMGDDGTWYVPKDLLAVYQEKVLPLADIISPNQWEAEMLSGALISDEASAISVMQSLYNKGPCTVALSSMNLPGTDNKILSYVFHQGEKKPQCVKSLVDKIPSFFVGSGDLFSSLFLAWSHKYPGNIQKVLSIVQSTLNIVLTKTYQHAKEKTAPEQQIQIKDLELKLIQCKSEIEKAPQHITVTNVQV